MAVVEVVVAVVVAVTAFVAVAIRLSIPACITTTTTPRVHDYNLTHQGVIILKSYECVFFVLLSLVMWGPDGQTLTPDGSRNPWKLILEFGQKWSRGGPEVVRECWFLVLNQEHTVPTETCFSDKIMALCKDHHPLPRS